MDIVKIVTEVIGWISLLFIIQLNIFPGSVKRLKTKYYMSWTIIISQFVASIYNLLVDPSIWIQIMCFIVLVLEEMRNRRLKVELDEGRSVE